MLISLPPCLARFKPYILEEHVFMGGNDPHPGRRGGCAGVLGVRRIATMAGENIMPAPDHPVHRGGFFA